ncbi:phosphate transporter [Lucifera butyrica]|uniref:Phosphate transporter n=1 Tax=Lucifera butyrica TaxID=1351585 RepID=A0A498REN8_9FIRM|nr:inorganic phosphate transporter [Lucifera butyrica]VBB09475.1 phosphate transporter [Lucifera butyrica]
MAIDILTILFLAVLLLAFGFTLTNGLHDASSVVATFISCGAATPVQAVSLAAVFELLGALFSGHAVANTITSIGKLPTDLHVLPVILAALLGAVIWNVVTWNFGLPSSSTHALVGGLVGAIWAAYGAGHIVWGWNELLAPPHQLSGFLKVVVSLLVSPLAGFIAGYGLQKISLVLLRRARFSTMNRKLKRFQWLMAALLAFGHGGNDSQKTIGLIGAVLVAAQMSPAGLPLWVRISVGLLMSAGMLSGGWRIMRTVGRGIYDVRPLHSLVSQVAAGGSVVIATMLGAPVSTTHVVVGSVTGVGGAEEYRMVNWRMGQDILIAWVVTIPAAALMASISYLFLHPILGG